MSDLEAYRRSDQEVQRTSDLLRALPRGYRTVLDVGARDDHFSRLLTDYFEAVTALDLEPVAIDCPRVTSVAGDITGLTFEDRSFDVVFCTEVLEHISALGQACRELSRVATHAIVVGVPFEQETRIGRTTCARCGRVGPPWGHVNRFTEEFLYELFPGWRPVSTTFVGSIREATSPLAVWLMDLGSNPWGTYSQDEHCVHCGAPLVPPTNGRPLWRRSCSALGLEMQRFHTRLASRHAAWIHVVFKRRQADA